MQPPHRVNTYEQPSDRMPNRQREKSDFNKQELVDSTKPVPPSDPEYATLSEWREMNGLRNPEQPSVTNPFYASSVSITTKSNIAEPSNYLDVVESGFSPEGVQNLTLSCDAHSLQDMRSATLKKERTCPPMGPIPIRRTQTLVGGYHSRSTHNLTSRAATVTRNNSMKSTVSTDCKPVPPPRPNMVKRSASIRSMGSVEPYLLQAQLHFDSHVSPLTQSIRVPESVAHGDDDGDDVGNDNYITLP